jgi:hypothetical protein
MPCPGTVYGLLTRHTFNGKKRPLMCPLNELQLTSAQRRQAQRSGIVAIWRKSAVDWRSGGELRAAGSPLRFVSMRDLQVKRSKSEDQWQQS